MMNIGVLLPRHVSGVNIRQSPSLDANVVGVLSRDNHIIATWTGDEWLNVNLYFARSGAIVRGYILASVVHIHPIALQVQDPLQPPANDTVTVASPLTFFDFPMTTRPTIAMTDDEAGKLSDVLQWMYRYINYIRRGYADGIGQIEHDGRGEHE